MKTGKSFNDFLIELRRQKEIKRDFIADTRKVAVKVTDQGPCNLAIEIPTVDDVTRQAYPVAFPINSNAIRQIAARLQIPIKYAQRLWETHPDILAHDINALFGREPEKRMIRTLDGSCRAFLSDRYRILDNFDVAARVLTVMDQILPEDIKSRDVVQSCEVTEARMYIKIVHPEMVAQIPIPEGLEMGKGHNFFVETIQAGITISNSEIGLGRVALSPGVFTRRCTNYAVFKSDEYSKFHVGKKQGKEGKAVSEIYSHQTLALEDATTFSQIADVARAAMDGRLFKKHVRQLTEARTQAIDANPIDAVESLANQQGLNDAEADAIMQHLMEGGEYTKYGLHNAITRAAQDVDDYDRATELEDLGGKIIELAPTDWKVIAEVKKAA